MWWRRRLPDPPRIRFDGTAPRKGSLLVRLPAHPVLASVALDAVHTLRETLEGGSVVILAPPGLFPLAHHHMEGLTLLSLNTEKPDRADLFSGFTFAAFWDLDEDPPTPAWVRAIYPHLAGPHFAFHEHGTFVFRLNAPHPDRWREAFALVGVPWAPLRTPVDPKEEKSVVDFLKGRFDWKGEVLVAVENGVDAPPSWKTIPLNQGELSTWSVSRLRALLALARVYVGSGVLAGEALRLGLVTVLTEPLPVQGTLTLSEDLWETLKEQLLS